MYLARRIQPFLRQLKRQGLALLQWLFPVLVVLFAVLILFFPPDVQQIISPYTFPPGFPTPPSIFPYPVGLPGVGANCPNKCEYDVCVHWVPGPSADCPHPGPGGGCCLGYQTKCDQQCADEENNQPPRFTVSELSCLQNGQAGWCIGALTLELSAADPQGQTILISGDVDGTPFACANGAGSCSV